ncbi:MAG: hypothetical protein Q7T01_02270 [bacterium]|nr:hypothetical protein [bacterium]
MLTTIGIILIVIGGATIAVHVVRAWPRLQQLRVRARIVQSRDAAAINRILVERLTRRARTLQNDLGRKAAKHAQGAASALDRGYRRLRLLAHEHATPPVAGTEAESCEAHIVAARDAFTAGELERAEEEYLACLKIDAKYFEAYSGLAGLYRARKEDALAEETLRFLTKLYPKNPESFVMLADVFHAGGKSDAAAKEMDRALRLEPKNPRFLDFAVELAIINGERVRGTQLIGRLRQANPDNQKLDDFDARIRAL